MTQFFYYRNAPGATAFDVDLGATAVRLGDEEGFVERAEHCQVGMSNVVLDDEAGTLGHSSDAILGHQRLEIDETDMASGNRALFRGFTTARGYARLADPKAPQVGVARQIECELADLNALPSFRVIPQSDTTAKRPAETAAARLAWILASTYLSGLVADNGLVASAAAFGCDATDYRGQRPVNVINDCELAADWFAFVYPDETKTVPASLFFDNANTSTAYTSTLRISNVLSDLDTTTAATFTTGITFAPSRDARLHRDPVELGSGVFLPYAKGAVYETRAATAAIYGYRDLTAPNANVKTSSKAIDIADKFLWTHHTEEDRISVTIELPTNKVNSIRAGHRMQVKFSHLPGYESFTWCRVLMRSVGQRNKTNDRYSVQLELSPQEAAQPAAAIVQSVFGYVTEGGGNLTLPNPVTLGNLLVYVISDANVSNPVAPNTAPALARWGSTAWTKKPNSTAECFYGGVAIWYKTADTVEQTGWTGATHAAIGIYELAGANIAAATTQFKTMQSVANPMTIGALGTAAAGSVAIMVGNWVDASLVVAGATTQPTWDGTAAGWTLDQLTTVPAVYPRWAPPVSYIAHALGAGAALSASGTRSALQFLDGGWGGAAILIPPV